MSLPAPAPIAEYHAMDRARFDAEVRPAGQPAVFRGLVSDWPAVAAARQSERQLFDYMLGLRVPRPVDVAIAPPEIEGRFFYSEDFRTLNFGRGTSPLDPFLDRLLRDRDNPRPYAIAVQSLPIPEILPGFERANRTDLVDPTVVPRMWMGNKVRVATHNDLQENIGCVVAGRRRFTLFPPDQVANLYLGPLDLTPAGTPISLVDPLAPDLDRFPRFADAMAVAQVAELAPGDAIYIPYHWWHAVDSLDAVNLFVNYWWNPAPAGLGDPYLALMHGLLSLRNLPADQRAAWRAMFDHFVFCADGDPSEHLPPHARGILAPATAEQIERMRATLKQSFRAL